MNYRVSLLLDKYIGNLIVRFLKLFKKKSDNTYPKNFSKIAILKFAEMGGAVHFLPHVSAMCDKYGDQNIFFICLSGNQQVVEVLDRIPKANIFEIRNSNIITLVKDIIKLFVFLKKNNIDLLIDLNLFSNLGRIICFFSPVDISVGMGDDKNKNLYSYQVPFQKQISHISEIYNQYTSFMNLVLNLKLDSVFRSSKKKQKTSELKIAMNLNINDILPLRKWPKENYIKLIKLLVNKYNDIEIYLIGTPEEKLELDSIVSSLNLPCVYNKSGTTHSLQDLISFLKGMHLLISSDSGPIHFSSLVNNLKLIALFGPESPKRFSSKKNNAIELYKDISCSPCFNPLNRCSSKCKLNTCMTSISPDEVLFAVEKIIGNI